MANLDDLGAIKRLDRNSMLTNVNELPDQIEAAWQQVGSFAVPSHYVKHSNIVMLGVGSPVLAGEMVEHLTLATCKVPVIVHRDFHLPQFADAKSLVIGLSYSGNTQEVLGAFDQAGRRGAKLLAIATNGTLESLTRKYKAPFFKISYGSQPRAAIGYFVIALAGIFEKFGYCEITDDHVTHAIELLKNLQAKNKPEVETRQSLAKQIALRIADKIPVIVAGGRLQPVAKWYKQQLNLNAKAAGFSEALPEMLQNTAVGLELPKDLKQRLFYIVLQSESDHNVHKHQQKILFEILEKYRIEYESLVLPAEGNHIGELLQYIHFGDYLSFYAAIHADKDPEESMIADFVDERVAQLSLQ